MAESNMATTSGKTSMVLLDQLRCDTYQRGDKPYQKKIVANFNPKACPPLTVAKRSDGSLWVIDGRQRLGALKALGIKKWEARVSSSTGPEEEARTFVIMNGGEKSSQKAVTRDVYRALLVARDPVALDMRRAVESAGLELASSGNKKWPKLTCLGFLMDCTRNFGKDVVERGLRLLVSIWPGNGDCLQDPLVYGCIMFIHLIPDGDVQRFKIKNMKYSPQTLIHKSQAYAAGRRQAAYAFMADNYNKGVRKQENKIPLRIADAG